MTAFDSPHPPRGLRVRCAPSPATLTHSSRYRRCSGRSASRPSSSSRPRSRSALRSRGRATCSVSLWRGTRAPTPAASPKEAPDRARSRTIAGPTLFARQGLFPARSIGYSDGVSHPRGRRPLSPLAPRPPRPAVRSTSPPLPPPAPGSRGDHCRRPWVRATASRLRLDCGQRTARLVEVSRPRLVASGRSAHMALAPSVWRSWRRDGG